ncbi:MAG: hypothetical protein ACJ8C4_08595 [Gemmataceae bacterium]
MPKTEVKGAREFQRLVFDFARWLKAVPEISATSTHELRNVIREWHTRAGDRLKGRTFTDTYAAFVAVWPKVRHSIVGDPVTTAWSVVQSRPLPLEAQALAITFDEKLAYLVALCKELASADDSGVFFLSGYSVEKVMGVPQRTAAERLKLLTAEGFLKVVDSGGGFENGVRIARSYRYLGGKSG